MNPGNGESPLTEAIPAAMVDPVVACIPSKASGSSDEALMARVQTDDRGAFQELYDRHAGGALRVARAVCRDTGRAEDAVQEGFLSIWKGRADYRSASGTFRAWSMRIVQNRAIDSVRASAARPPAQAVAETPQADLNAASTSDRVVARIEGQELLASIGRLPAAQSEVIVLSFYEQLSHAEIATQLAVPTGTVKGRMRLGLAKMRREMDTARIVS
jgi:RNA polymerase sigma-70 factor (ECF subfamily)